MKKKNLFFRGCVQPMLNFLLIAAALLLWTGCPDTNTNTVIPDNPPEEQGLAAPENVSVSMDGDTLELTWNAVQGASNYEISYTVGSGEPATDETAETSYTVSGIQMNTLYTFTVRAVDGEKRSDWSEEKEFTTTVMAVPPAPEGLTLDTNIGRSLAVYWEAVVQPGAEITYKVAYGKDDNETAATVHGENITATSATITDLDANTLYYVWVWARNQTGTGYGDPAKESAMVQLNSGPVVAGAPAGAPVLGGEAAYEVGSTVQDGLDYGNSTLQTWLAQPNTDAGKDKELLSGVFMAEWQPVEGATSYDVFVATSATQTPPARPAASAANVTGLSYFIRDSDPSLYHFIWVRARNNRGAGPVSSPYGGRVRGVLSLANSRRIQTTTDTNNIMERAGFPRNLTATVTGEGSVRLSWNRGDRAAWYEVYYSENLADLRIMTGGISSREMLGTEWNEDNPTQGRRLLVPYRMLTEFTPGFANAIPWNGKAGAAGNPGEIYKIHALHAEISGLDPAKRYYFLVRSLNHNGERGLARTPDNTTAGNGLRPTLTTGMAVPADVQVNPVSPAGGGKLKVIWNAVAGATGYRIYYSKYPVPGHNLRSVTLTSNSITEMILTHLDENNVYYIWVVALGANDAVSPFSEMKSGVPNVKDGTEPPNEKLTLRGRPLKTHIYIEVNSNDPRLALGYKLETGQQFFDQVILFASNLRIGNCATDGQPHGCRKNGPHIHHNENVRYILENRDKYIRPLQEAGIKVLMGTLPDHQIIGYHSFGQANSFTASNYSHFWTGDSSVYPLSDETVINAFFDDLVGEIEKYGLDGFDIDDEYVASNHPSMVNAAQNIANFIYRARIRLDEGTPAGADRKIISMYDYAQVGLLNQSGLQFGPPGGLMNVNPRIWEYADLASYSSYGGSGPGGLAGCPRMQYSPTANKIGATAGASSYTNNDWGYMMFFDVTSANISSSLNSFNIMARPIWGLSVIHEGPSYHPKDW